MPELKERWDESLFTQERALNALKGLETYVRKPPDGSDPWPFFPIIQGYMLKRDALAEVKAGKSSISFEQYCNFVTQPGVHRD